MIGVVRQVSFFLYLFFFWKILKLAGFLDLTQGSSSLLPRGVCRGLAKKVDFESRGQNLRITISLYGHAFVVLQGQDSQQMRDWLLVIQTIFNIPKKTPGL